MKNPFRYIYYRFLRAKSQQKKPPVGCFGVQLVYSDRNVGEKGRKRGPRPPFDNTAGLADCSSNAVGCGHWDHLEQVADVEWVDMREAAWDACREGKFVAIPGLEWTKKITRSLSLPACLLCNFACIPTRRDWACAVSCTAQSCSKRAGRSVIWRMVCWGFALGSLVVCVWMRFGRISWIVVMPRVFGAMKSFRSLSAT